MSYRKEYIQKGELEFINKVVEAVVKRDVSKVLCFASKKFRRLQRKV